HFANTHEALVLGTGNKTEIEIGYFTKYGDGACDLLPLGGLYKTEVGEAAKLLGIPNEIIEKTPSAELAEGQTDENEIGMTYAEMDDILKKFAKGKKLSSQNEKTLRERITDNRHKNLPPVIL
ncbi:NAD(+) synthase, partial [Candidatus Peregrinibacteria bacterium]|nr:NAD(+) synthase [Candidatus Peregrinibacteria bacterium]